VVVRPMMAVVESAASCLGVSEEMMMDICQSESTLSHSSPRTEVSCVANVDTTITRRYIRTQGWPPLTIETIDISDAPPQTGSSFRFRHPAGIGLTIR
jgi:hypothetical protein